LYEATRKILKSDEEKTTEVAWVNSQHNGGKREEERTNKGIPEGNEKKRNATVSSYRTSKKDKEKPGS